MSSHPALREGGPTTAPRIALLDNDPSVLTLMHALLTDEGYRTLRCRPGDVVSAHALVKRARPVLVILDPWLAEHEDGWAFLTHLWSDSETIQLPALIVTGKPVVLPEHAAVLHALHCQVVKKPFALHNLLDAIAALLGPSPVQRDGGPHRHVLPAADAAVPARRDEPLVAAGEDL